MLSRNFTKVNTKFSLSLHYNEDSSHLFLNKIFKFEADNKYVDSPSQFRLRSISRNSDYDESEEVSYKGSVHDFSVDYEATDKSNILNIHKYLTV